MFGFAGDVRDGHESASAHGLKAEHRNPVHIGVGSGRKQLRSRHYSLPR